MKIAPLADVKARLSAYMAESAREGPIVITRNGRPAAVLLTPIDADDLDRLILARSRRLRALLEKSRRSIQAGKGLPETEFWHEVARRGRARTRSARRG